MAEPLGRFYDIYTDIEDRLSRDDESADGLSPEGDAILRIGRGEESWDNLTPSFRQRLYDVFKVESGPSFNARVEHTLRTNTEDITTGARRVWDAQGLDPRTLPARSWEAIKGGTQMVGGVLGVADAGLSSGVADVIRRSLGAKEAYQWPIEVGTSIIGGASAARGLKKLGTKGAAALGDIVGGAVVKPDIPVPAVADVLQKAYDPKTGLVLVEDLPEYKALVKELMPHLMKSGLDQDVTQFPEGMRLYLRLMALQKAGLADANPKLVEFMKRTGMNTETSATFMASGVRHGAQLLNILSQAERQLQRMAAENPQVRQLLGDMVPLETAGAVKARSELAEFGDKVYKKFTQAESARIGIMVSQTVTAVRNAISQAGRYSMDVAEDALASYIHGEDMVPIVKDALGDFVNLGSYIKKQSAGQRTLADDLLEMPAGEFAKVRLLGEKSITEGGMLNGTLKWLNRMNIAQEHMFRKLSFDSKMRQLAARDGKDITQMDPKDIPDSWLGQATDHALRMTFSAPAESEFGKSVIRVMSNPIMTALVQPFPRFALANSLKFTWDYMGGKMLSPDVLRKIAKGGDVESMKALAQVSTGWTMLSMAHALRSDPDRAGAKWYEVKDGNGNVYDTRPMAPFSTFLFLAENMIRPPGSPTSRVSGGDWAEALAGLNRVSGSGLTIVDALRDLPTEKAYKVFGSIASHWAGSFGVVGNAPWIPLGWGRMAAGGIGPSQAAQQVGKWFPDSPLGPERFNRDTTQNVFGSPETGLSGDEFLSRIPGLRQLLPPAYSPFKGGPMESTTSGLAGLAALRSETPNFLERETENVMFAGSGVKRAPYPQESDPTLEYEVKKRQGPIAEVVSKGMENSPGWRKISPVIRAEVLKKTWLAIRKMATQQAKADLPPELAGRIMLDDKLDGDLERILKYYGFDPKTPFTAR